LLAMVPEEGSSTSLLLAARRQRSRARLVRAVTAKRSETTVENATGQERLTATLVSSMHWPTGTGTGLAMVTEQLPAAATGWPQLTATGVAEGDGDGVGEDDGLGLGLDVGVGVTDGLGLGDGETLGDGEGLGPG